MKAGTENLRPLQTAHGIAPIWLVGEVIINVSE